MALTRGPATWQGELLDQIEYTVAQSVNYTGKAVEELRTAQNYQKKVRTAPPLHAPARAQLGTRVARGARVARTRRRRGHGR